MDYTEKVLRPVNRYHGVIVDVRVDMVTVPNGNITLREVVEHPGGVCVVALDKDDCVYMVRQYRFPLGEHLLELPAGKLEKGEEPLSAAQRELSEETGLSAEKWESLGFLYTSPGFSTERLYLYLATELTRGQPHLDLNEFLDVERIPLSQLTKMVMRGELCDAKTISGVLKTVVRLNPVDNLPAS
jgi:NTP pyrophosphohydrolases including oxidative damage repair enzymes